MARYLSEIIVEGKDKDKKEIMDNLYEPYIFLVDDKRDRLIQAVNIVAKEKGYKVLNLAVDAWNKEVFVMMEKQK